MKKKVVIVGAGFAGLSCYIALKKSSLADVTVIDYRRNFEYHPSMPLALMRDRVLKKIVVDLPERYGSDFLQEEVSSIEGNQIVTESGKKISFDYLVIATGSLTNYFGNKNLENCVLPFKQIQDVSYINEQLHDAKTVAIVGGGYTGVEIASVLASSDKHVVLIHGMKQLLERLDIKAHSIALSYLQKKGVDVMLDDLVVDCKEDRIILKSGREVACDVSIMSAGVIPNDRVYKQKVNERLQSLQDDHIFLCGDVASTGRIPTAQNAIIEGRIVARSIVCMIGGQKAKDPCGPGAVMAISLGRYWGILVVGKKCYKMPFVGFMKWVIERMNIFQFKHKVELPI